MNGPDFSSLLATVQLGSLVSALLAIAALYMTLLVVMKGVRLLLRSWLDEDQRRSIEFFERGGRDLRNF